MRCKNCKWFLSVANAILTPEQIKLVDSGESLELRVDIKNISQSISEQDRETAYGLSNISPNLLRIVCFIWVMAAATGIIIVVIAWRWKRRG